MNLKSRHIFAAFALHLLLFGFLFSGVQCSRKPTPVSIIQGTLISANQLPRAQAEPKSQPVAEPPAPEPAPAEPAKPEPPKPDPAQVKREQEQVAEKAKAAEKRKQDEILQQQTEARTAAVKKQAEAEEKKRSSDEATKKAAADEQKRVDDLRKATEAEDKKRLTDEKKKKDAQAQADAEARRQAQAELAVALGAEAEQRQSQEVSIWGTQLVAAIQRVWTRPAGTEIGLKCVLKIELSPTGEVRSAIVTNSSGNTLFDDSASRAVYKASPLPLPRDPTVFQSSINITFNPKK